MERPHACPKGTSAFVSFAYFCLETPCLRIKRGSKDDEHEDKESFAIGQATVDGHKGRAAMLPICHLSSAICHAMKWRAAFSHDYHYSTRYA
jgi:hypothetical protein